MPLKAFLSVGSLRDYGTVGEFLDSLRSRGRLQRDLNDEALKYAEAEVAEKAEVLGLVAITKKNTIDF